MRRVAKNVLINYQDFSNPQTKCFACVQAFNVGKRKTFTLNWQKLRKEIEDEKAGILPAPVPIQRPPPGKRKAKGGANKGNAKNKGRDCNSSL